MSTFVPLPLGQRIPGNLHGVSCSLPTMQAVRGYEEKDPAILSQMTSGYPRFVLHPLVRQLAGLFAQELELREHTVWLTCSARSADELARELGAAHPVRFTHDGLHGIAHPVSPELFQRAKSHLQNVGGFLGSREAEDHLVRRGVLPAAQPEASVQHGALDRVVGALRRFFPGTAEADIVIAPSGMNAFHAAWRTLAELQASRGRTVWLQLGWLYLDTIALLRRYATRPVDHVYLPRVTDLEAVRAACAAAGTRLAGLVTEAPTNPLVQTGDVEALSRLVRDSGGRVLIDPTLVSALNVRVLPYADVAVTSLTKYCASEGDLLAGAAIINPAGPDAAYLRTRIAHRADSIYRRDLARLAAEIDDTEAVIRTTNASAPRVIEFLRQHPNVKVVYWSLQPESRANYLKLAGDEQRTGAMVSFTVRKPLAEFYDRLRLPKGPSFGMKRTLICPFIYLAHYDLVTTAAGRAELAASGIDPELLRLSIGCEPVDDIIAALAEALD